ncbi:hypothetical protein HD554DRAFT_2171836 [Boletus coccyginus]|nr:hypothetical protein HD554DRAFT_2171836 [Boletus coccyginus]
MGGSTEAMMPGRTAGKTGIVTETGTGTETETETGTGTGIGDTTDEKTPGGPRTTIVQTVEEDMVPGTVNGALGMTTEQNEIGSEGGAGTARISVPEIASMTDDMLPRPIVLYHPYPRVVIIAVCPLLLPAAPSRHIHLGQGVRLRPEAQETGLVDHPPCLTCGQSRQTPVHLAMSLDRQGAHLLVEQALAQINIHAPRRVLYGGSTTVPVEDQPVEGAAVLDGQMDVEMTTEPLTEGKDRSDNREAELRIKAESPRRTGSPTECQQLIPNVETVAVPSNEAVVTQPYLPTIPRYDAKPRFSVAYESEASPFDQEKLIALMQRENVDAASKQAVEHFTSWR